MRNAGHLEKIRRQKWAEGSFGELEEILKVSLLPCHICVLTWTVVAFR
jgi:hypothetical protein